MDEDRGRDEEVKASRVGVGRLDIHVYGGGIQPGEDPQPDDGGCWRAGMRGSVSTSAQWARKGLKRPAKGLLAHAHRLVGLVSKRMHS